MKTFDQRGSWPSQQQSMKMCMELEYNAKYEFTCGDDWTLSTPTHGNMLGVLIHAKIWTTFG